MPFILLCRKTDLSWMKNNSVENSKGKLNCIFCWYYRVKFIDVTESGASLKDEKFPPQAQFRRDN